MFSTETVVEFWRLRSSGMTTSKAAVAAGVSQQRASEWVIQSGGMPPRQLFSQPSGRFLSAQERVDISLGLAAGDSLRAIAARLGRSPSTISREIARNKTRSGDYQPLAANHLAFKRARRPKPRRLHTEGQLRCLVQAMLREKMSPEQISGRLQHLFGDDSSMRVSHETIYQAIYVQGNGSLRRELAKCLRTGRALRRPKRSGAQRRARIPDKVMISERPPEVDDRAIPGHWEGDLIIGKNNGSAIGTLVERSTRYLMLLHLPERHDAESVRDEMIRAASLMPEHLRKSLTWDQGIEMTRHAEIRLATDLDIYFCDPHSPWQRGTNENTNGLLRQYFPKGTNLSAHTRADLDFVANQMNQRPRKTLGYMTPAEKLNQLLSHPPELPAVATTA